MAFLPPPRLRHFLATPTQDKVDFRAACFCHKNIIDVGFVCSVCLSSALSSSSRRVFEASLITTLVPTSFLPAGTCLFDLPVSFIEGTVSNRHLLTVLLQNKVSYEDASAA